MGTAVPLPLQVAEAQGLQAKMAEVLAVQAKLKAAAAKGPAADRLEVKQHNTSNAPGEHSK